MTKRKITVELDEALYDRIQKRSRDQGNRSLASIVREVIESEFPESSVERELVAMPSAAEGDT